MRLATISTPQWASQFQKGEYHMVLAHWVLEYPEYAGYYANADRPPGTHIILDNGRFEGADLALDQLLDAFTMARADELVLPDVLGRAGETLRQAWEAVEYLLTTVELVRNTHGQLDLCPTAVMFVPQATSVDEWHRCLSAWLEKWYKKNIHKVLSLSIGMAGACQKDMPPRDDLLNKLDTSFPVHLLGVPNIQDLITEIPLAHEKGVRGLDTSIPFALGARGILLTPRAVKFKLGNPKNYNEPRYSFWPLIRLNTLILQHWLHKGEVTGDIPIELVRQVASRETQDRAVFTNPQFALRACGVQPGSYIVKRTGGPPHAPKMVSVRLHPPGSVNTSLLGEGEEVVGVVR